MKKLMLILLGIVGGLVGLFVILVLVTAYFSKPLPSTGEVLAKLPAGERQALENLCSAAGVEPVALRPIYGWDDRLMSDERNRLNIGLRDGHIRGIRLNGRKLTSLPDLGGLPELEAFWLDDNQIGSADLRASSTLQTVNLSRNHLTSLAGLRFPASLRRLYLAENEIADLGPLTSLSALTELDLSNNRVTELAPLASLGSLKTLLLGDNQVTAFDALLPLPLEQLDLRHNRVAAFPERLPKPPTWKVNLDDNPVLGPPGYLRRRSYKVAYAGTGGGKVSQRGFVYNGRFEVSGTWQHLPALREVELNASKATTRAIGNVTLEASVRKGRVRFYLYEPGGFWKSPWIGKGLVEGFGFIRAAGWVYADAAPEQPVRLVGVLLDGSGHDRPFEFQMEPLDGLAEEISYRVYREE